MTSDGLFAVVVSDYNTRHGWHCLFVRHLSGSSPECSGDVYDALTTRRVYKPPFSREQAKAIITEGSGLHFDPNIVAAFLSKEAEFYQIAERLADH